MTFSIALSLITIFGGLAVWGLRAYITRTSSAAIDLQEKAGAAISQTEAQNEENTRVTAASNAGDAAGGLRPGQVDAYDEAGK